MRWLSEADNGGFGRGGAGGHSGGSGERRPQHHGSESRGGCRCGWSAGLRQEALLNESFGVWGHLTQRWKTSLRADDEHTFSSMCPFNHRVDLANVKNITANAMNELLLISCFYKFNKWGSDEYSFKGGYQKIKITPEGCPKMPPKI